MFVSKIIDAAGEAGETVVWLGFSRDCNCVNPGHYEPLISGYDKVNRMLYAMADKPENSVKAR